MIKLAIKYSIKDEVERIQSTIAKLDWYKEKGYKLCFPESFSTEDPNFKNEDYIENSIKNEYNEEDYKEKEDFIIEHSEKINTALDRFFKETGIKSQDNYEILLTKYGVGGSYGFPSLVLINTQFCRGGGLIITIIHEIIHISIEDLIQKYNVGHWEKETIVDSIFEKIAPELAPKRSEEEYQVRRKIDKASFDKVFEKYYPNIEDITKNLKN